MNRLKKMKSDFGKGYASFKGSVKRKAEDYKIAILSTTIVSSLYGGQVLASNNKYVQNAGDWLLDGIQYIALVMAAGMLITFLVKRQFMKAIITLISSSIIIAIIFNPGKMKDIGNYLVSIIFG